MPNWLYILLVVLTSYLLISVLLYFLQDYFLFKPEKLSKDFQFHYDNQVIEEYNVETRDGA
ncbi:MAG: alpha/beta hydrolase, partial [Bacteroidota bacterium]